jgi:hypothetical protein
MATKVQVRPPRIADLFSSLDDSVLADAALSKAKRPKHSVNGPVSSSSGSGNNKSHTDSGADANAAAKPAAQPKHSVRSLREWMNERRASVTADTLLPNGQTCGAFLVEQWRSRAVKGDK